MEVLRRLAHKLIRRPGINEIAASARIPAPVPPTWVEYPIGLDIGEVADGHHLIARGISLAMVAVLDGGGNDKDVAVMSR